MSIDTAVSRQADLRVRQAATLERNQGVAAQAILDNWFHRHIDEDAMAAQLDELSIRGGLSLKIDTYVFTGYDYKCQCWRVLIPGKEYAS